ncbi:HAD family hydrolase [Chloroflexota bacterium]
MEKAVAVFDLEGTLFKPSRSFIHEIPKGRVRGITGIIKMAIFNISLMMLYICYKMHLVGGQAMRTATIKRIAALLKGSAERDVAQRTRVYAAKYMDLLRPEISRVLKEHKTKGHTTIMFSGMLKPYIEAVKQELGIDIAIGTELEIKDGYYTGRLASIPCFGERRAHVLSELINKLDYKINLGESFAYGDAIFDRFFMGMVGNPVAVHPDKKLAEYAKGHGWGIVI